MADKIPDGIVRGDIIKAIEDFDGGVSHPFLESTTYDLVFNGKNYPPKAIVGLAARRLSGATLTPKDFKGGEGTRCFQLLRGLGFEVVRKSEPPESGSILLPSEEATTSQFVEGATQAVLVNRYERDRQARRACIEHYGASCVVCGFDFSKVYGEIGEGFIHVHHLRELASIRSEYVVDAIVDLRPVCPNCHAMLHSEIPAASIERLAAMILGRAEALRMQNL